MLAADFCMREKRGGGGRAQDAQAKGDLGYFTGKYPYRFPFARRKTPEITNANISAVVIAHQTPSSWGWSRMGRSRTAATWKTRVRRKAMAAEIPPLLREVKKLDAKILNPMNKNAKE